MPPVHLLTLLFALAIGAIGILQLIFQQVLIGRPAAIISNTNVTTVIAVIIALALIICSVQLWRGRTTRWLFISLSVFVFIFSGGSNLFYVVQGDYGSILTSFGKAITMGSAILLYLHLPTSNVPLKVTTLARCCLGLFLFICGVQHFLFIEFVKTLVPRWIPFDAFWTYAAGVALILAGAALLMKFKVALTAKAAGWMVFIWLIVLHIPRAVNDPSANELTAVCEALAVSVILFTLATPSVNKEN